jgi:hypothetical protein
MTLKEANRVMSEIKEIRFCDFGGHFGECDRCHTETQIREDESEEGCFEYCADCWEFYGSAALLVINKAKGENQ